jgi:hypothetical protein
LVSPPPTSTPVAPPPALRPTRLDYFLILLGVALSLALAELSGYQARIPHNAPEWVPDIVCRLLPTFLFLPLGVVLFWPVFYITQRVLGRPQALTLGEWLWGVAWLGAVSLVVWITCLALASATEGVFTPEVRNAAFSAEVKAAVFTGYAIGALTLAAVALLLNVLDLVGRKRKPWTHAFGLVLMLWPALPLAGLLAWK